MTLIEVLIASGIVAIALLAGVASLMANRMNARRAIERDIMWDFAQHYIEIARSQDYGNIAPGFPINSLYDGSVSILVPATGQNETINISFPNDSSWYSLETNTFKYFHPDLQWLDGREAEYRCIVETQVAGTPPEERAKRIFLDLRWHPPLNRGAEWMTMSVETYVYPDFN